MKHIEVIIIIFKLIFKLFSGSNEDDSPYSEWLKDNGYEI